MSGQTTVEVEARLGLIASRSATRRATPHNPGSGAETKYTPDMKTLELEFVSGVSEPSMEQIRRSTADMFPVNMKPKYRPKEYTEVIYSYSDETRVAVDEAGKERREKKSALYQVSYQLPSAPYDLRLTVSLEEKNPGLPPLPAAADDATPPTVPSRADWSSKRRKRRSSYSASSIPAMKDSPARHWRIDLTEVETEEEGDTGDPSITHEVEFELQPDIQGMWLAEVDAAKSSGQTKFLADKIATLLELLNPMEPLSTITNPAEHSDARVCAAVKNRCRELSGNPERGTGFPGAMPLDLGRRDIQRLQRGDYFISEKTDGVRYLMVSIRDAQDNAVCALIDRSMNVYSVLGGEELAKVVKVGTVLDGELVHNRTGSGRAVFMVFDMLALGDTELMKKPFQMRFQAVADHIFKPYDRLCALPDGLKPHLKLVKKRFYRRTEICQLFSKIKNLGRERIYFEGDLRHHKTDGVIFQPNRHYTTGADKQLLKWKWKDLASIDLKVAMKGGGDVELSTVGENGDIDMSKVVHLTLQDKMRLLADMHFTSATIAEVAFDDTSGLWLHLGVRPDKDRPNFVRTVMSTLVELGEAISEQELQYRMLVPSPAEDDWYVSEQPK
ncbi:unnamed protein product [Chrysoparadoxa australica]